MSPVHSALPTHVSACAMVAAVVTAAVMLTTPAPGGVETSVPTIETQSLKHAVNQRRDLVRTDAPSTAEVEAVKPETKPKTKPRPRRGKIHLGDGPGCTLGL